MSGEQLLLAPPPFVEDWLLRPLGAMRSALAAGLGSLLPPRFAGSVEVLLLHGGAAAVAAATLLLVLWRYDGAALRTTWRFVKRGE